MARIVVGVDGSEHAVRALRWAVAEARLRDAELVLVHVATHPGLSPPTPATPQTQAELARLSRELVIDEALAAVRTEGIAVERRPLLGHPAEELAAAAEGADLLVVGARGLGGFRGLLLGSVTQHLLASATCPVAVIVPDGR
jgi:nucleotide-binding universal stress UspA family protein